MFVFFEGMFFFVWRERFVEFVVDEKVFEDVVWILRYVICLLFDV